MARLSTTLPHDPSARKALIRATERRTRKRESWDDVLFGALVCGFVYGICIEKSQVLITPTSMGVKYPIAKFFMTAVGVSQVGFVILSTFKYSRGRFFDSRLHVAKTPGVFAALVGGALIGIGYHLSGMAPSTLAVEIGRGVSSAWFTAIGALVGAFTYAVVQPVLTKAFDSKTETLTLTPEGFVGGPYHMMALPMGVALIVGALSLETFYPTRLPASNSEYLYLRMERWSPVVSGAVAGLIQIPAVLLADQSAQASNAYMTVVAQVSRFVPVNRGFLTKLRSGVANVYQIVFLIGSGLGALLSVKLVHTDGVALDAVEAAAQVAPGPYMLSGFLMLLGAQITGGSAILGHAMSGVAHVLPLSLLTTLSFVVVANLMGTPVA